MTVENELISTIEAMIQPGKGILAADESNGTIAKRFASINHESTEESRRTYRSLLCSTPGLNEYVEGVILFEETLQQKDDSGKLLPALLSEQGIVPGIKIDKGLTILPNTDDEKVTQGLDGLADRLATYKEQGARFAKWRNVYNITDATPSAVAMHTGAEVLARYAAICQNLGIVPIVEPEVLIDGTHDIEQCAEATEFVLNEVFAALFRHEVESELIILKPSMVISGKDCPTQASAEEVAEYTLSVFRNAVPASVPSINFLSGGQTPVQATENLQAINAMGDQPWILSFSYGRALQENCLKAWNGNAENINAAQDALIKRAKLNGIASLGEYESSME